MDDLFSSDLAQNVAAMGVTLLGLICLFTAYNAQVFDRYGREALAATGLWAISNGAFRFAVNAGAIDNELARGIVGFLAIVTMVGVAQVIWLGRKYRNHHVAYREDHPE